MKLIEGEKQHELFLDEGEVLQVKTLFQNKITIQISCKNHTLYVEDIIQDRIKEIKLEQEELEKMEQKWKKENS